MGNGKRVLRTGFSNRNFCVPFAQFETRWVCDVNGKQPMISLKRASEFDSRLCVFCQQRHMPKDDVRHSTEYSRNVVYEAMKIRSKLRDVNYREAIDRLEGIVESSDDDILIVWHRECYCQ